MKTNYGKYTCMRSQTLKNGTMEIRKMGKISVETCHIEVLR